MSQTADKKTKKLSRVLIMSPKAFFRWGCCIILIYLALHFLGLRKYTSLLSGTVPSQNVSVEWSVLMLSIYLPFYFGAYLLAPILIIASAIYMPLFKLTNKADVSEHSKEPF